MPTPANASDTYKQQIRAISSDVASFTDHGGVGDGVTDNLASWNTFISTYDNVYIPDGEYLFSEPMDIPAYKQVTGSGMYHSVIMGTEGEDSVINIGTGSTPPVGWFITLRDIGIGGSADSGLKIQKAHTLQIDKVRVQAGGTFDIAFDLDTFSSQLTNLYCVGADITTYGFSCTGDFNANWCCNWQTNTQNCEANIYLFAGAGHGTVFNMLTVQGGKIGLYMRSGYSFSVNAVYSENCVLPVKLGNYSGGNLIRGVSLSGLDLGGPFDSHASKADSVSCIDLNYCQGIAINGVDFTGSDNAGNYVAVTFTGDGSGAFGVARVRKDGTIHSIEVQRDGGSGWTSATVGIAPKNGGGGSGATATASVSGGKIVSVTMTDDGSGYKTAQCPVAINYTFAKNVVINGEFINDGQGNHTSTYMWLTRSSTAVSNPGIVFPTSQAQIIVSGTSRPISIRVTTVHNFALRTLDTNGDLEVKKIYTAPEFP